MNLRFLPARPALALALGAALLRSVHANVVPNPEFESPGPSGNTVTVTVNNTSAPAAAAGWTQLLLGGTLLQTTRQPSTDILAGSCGQMLVIRGNSPGTGSSGSTVSATLPAELPAGSRGSMDLRVVKGSVRVGFLVNLPDATVFDQGSVMVEAGGPAAPWRHITFQNSTRPAGNVALQVYAPRGDEAEVYVDNVVAAPPPEKRTARYDFPGYFGPLRKWIGEFAYPNQIPVVGDFDGDGLDDIATFLRSAYPAQAGHVYVARNTGSNFAFAGRWHPYFCVGDEIPGVGDFDGDGRDDIVTFVPSNGRVWIALSSGSAFCASREWYDTTAHGRLFAAGEVPRVGDFNGDGRADLAVFTRGATADVWVALNTGRAFAARTRWHDNFCARDAVPRVGDVDGDGRDDIVCFQRNSGTGAEAGDVNVALSTGSLFQAGPVLFWHQNFAPTAAYEPLLADLNGDGSQDIVAVHDDGRVFAAVATGRRSFASGPDGTATSDPHWQWHHDLRNPGEIPLVGRFNRDLNDDLAVFVRGERAGADFAATFVSFCGGHAQPEPDSRLADFGWGTMGAGPETTVRPLLLVLSECAGNPLTRTLADYEKAVFGPAHPNIAAWFREMSEGRFTFSKAAAVKIGPYRCPLPDATTWRTQLEDAANADGPGGFEFKNYDRDGDGTVENDELALLGISNFTPSGGRAIGFTTTLFPGTAREIRLDMTWSFAGESTGLHNMAHELCHGACGMVDLYGAFCRGQGLTLASCTDGAGAATDLLHLDAWHKIRMGWVKPLVYDLKYFPAGAALRPPQATADQPVILFDSSRGTREFYVLEHRNGLRSNGTATWTAAGGTWRVAPRDSFPAAGYDIDLRDTAGNRQGFVTWAVKTDASNNALNLIQGIEAGADNLLTSIARGDDVVWPDTGPRRHLHAGPDGLVQSITSGDDQFFQDALVLPTTTPGVVASRFLSSLNPSGQTATTLQWYDTSDSGITVRGDAINGNTWQFLEWGRNFRPWFDTVAAPSRPARAGDRLIVTGSLGQRARFLPRLTAPDGTIVDLVVETWTGAGATLRIPDTARQPGLHRLVIFDGASLRPSSPSWPVTLAPATFTIAPVDVWRETAFTRTEAVVSSVAGDDADPDRDGTPNLAEYLLGMNPKLADTPSVAWTVSSAGSLTATITAPADRGCIRVTIEQSDDLASWTPGQWVVFDGSGTAASTRVQVLTVPIASATEGFARLRFSRCD